MEIRKAKESDLDAVARIYEQIHDAEEAGTLRTSWVRGVYPTRATAETALARGDLFVLEEDGKVLAAARINREQMEVYAGAPWEYPAAEEEVCVLHTLVVSPFAARRGCGERFVRFYEDNARARGCTVLRIDTSEINTAARAMYRKLGFREAAILPVYFNAIPGVRLVLLEKRLMERQAEEEKA